jgi:hypothetical protein
MVEFSLGNNITVARLVLCHQSFGREGTVRNRVRIAGRIGILAFAVFFLAGCFGGSGAGTIDEGSTNAGPVFVALNMPDTVEAGASIAVSCSATDPEGDPMTYTWSTVLGEISGTGSSVTYTAPDMLYETIDYILVKINDSYKTTSQGIIMPPLDRSAYGYITIHVIPKDVVDPLSGIADNSIFLWPSKGVVKPGEDFEIYVYASIPADSPLYAVGKLALSMEANGSNPCDASEISLGDLFHDQIGEWTIIPQTEENCVTIVHNDEGLGVAGVQGVLAVFKMHVRSNWQGASPLVPAWGQLTFDPHFDTYMKVDFRLWSNLVSYYEPTVGYLNVFPYYQTAPFSPEDFMQFEHIGKDFGTGPSSKLLISVDS